MIGLEGIDPVSLGYSPGGMGVQNIPPIIEFAMAWSRSREDEGAKRATDYPGEGNDRAGEGSYNAVVGNTDRRGSDDPRLAGMELFPPVPGDGRLTHEQNHADIDPGVGTSAGR